MSLWPDDKDHQGKLQQVSQVLHSKPGKMQGLCKAHPLISKNYILQWQSSIEELFCSGKVQNFT